MRQSNRIVQYLVTFAVSLAAATQGISSAWPTPVLAKFYANETDIQITDNEMAWVVAMSSPGFIVGSVITRYSTDFCGRKATLLLSAVPVLMGSVVLNFAKLPWLLYVTRFLWGITTGFIVIVVSMYTAEIADKEIRGFLTLITRFMFNFGSLLVMAIGSFVSYETLNYLMLGMPVAYFVACSFIPESPYYLLKTGKVDRARKSLTQLRRYKDQKVLEDELQQLQTDVRKDMRRSGSVKELFTGKAYRKAVIIATGLRITQLMTGMLTVQQFLGRIMQESKTHIKLSTVFIVFGAVRSLTSLMSSTLADRVGRRPLLIYSYLGTAISLFIVGGYFFLLEVIKLDRDTLSRYGFVTFTGIILANVISTVGYNSLISVIPAEIFPMNVKAVALTCLNLLGGVLSFTMSRGYHILKQHFGLCGVFWILTLAATSGMIFSIMVVPETKGKSLSEIQQILQGQQYNDDAEERLNQPGCDTDKEKCDDIKQELREIRT